MLDPRRDSARAESERVQGPHRGRGWGGFRPPPPPHTHTHTFVLYKIKIKESSKKLQKKFH